MTLEPDLEELKSRAAKKVLKVSFGQLLILVTRDYRRTSFSSAVFGQNASSGV